MNQATQLDEIPWWKKAAIGALGGLALTLLKLIDARFYVDAVSNIEVQAAYFTYLAYMILGSLAAVFISDHELPPRKIMRSAFVLGLLAPSVFLAIVSQPVRVSTPQRDVPIPKISALPFSSAHAEESSVKSLPPLKPLPGLSPLNPAELSLKVDFKTLPKSALEPSFFDAFRAAIGRRDLADKYVYVVGSTVDKDKALETATLTNEILARTGNLKSSIIQIAGQPNYYVTVGGFVDRQEALKIKAESNAQAAKFFASGIYPANGIPAGDRSKIAVLLADAPVVTTKALWTTP